ncbi:polynucleotide kinase [Pectobacterium bacteriophage PM2]|uniref:Polynucleotide 5'-kinase and 3'-phosphatase n=1 Tax=Pectobacterium bacteriophage PM2 TaxID=1429794 RepID=A0A0A0Q0P0_9CAUD|nr:polynucleotide kinase [Pectobacterium bacteriophage PM2]AHY25201.1 polynucleotide 5'-kinase and 3'-phosphatase [Pectobacterium bacteriophage PM2]
MRFAGINLKGPKMKEIILTVGCPGSGKSTWARKYAEQNQGYFIINRDSLRVGIHGDIERNNYKYTKAKEKIVTELQLAHAKTILSSESCKGVIISDTNLNKSRIETWSKFAEENNCKFTEQVIDVPWLELLKRNQYRGTEAVPLPVLRSMYKAMKEYMGAPKYVPNGSLPKAVIFDLDGTLAIHTARSPYDLDKLDTDAPNRMVVEYARMLHEKGYKIITVSGRESGTKENPLKYYEMTKTWMNEFNIPWDRHYQRKQGDSRSDMVVKEEILLNGIADRYNVVLAVDDRDQVVEMWRQLGIECWQVNFGEF